MGYSLDNIDGILLRREDDILLGESLKKNTSSIRRYVKSLGRRKPIETAESTFQAVEKEEEETPHDDNATEDMFSQKKYEEIMEEIFHIPEIGYEDSSTRDETRAEVDEKQTEKDYNILDILNFFPCSEPLTINLQGYNWWMIDIESSQPEKNFLPYFNYAMGMGNKSHRFEDKIEAKQLLNKYGHYIFGLYNEKDKIKFYIYGVPGKFSLDEHPRSGSTGFNTWFEGHQVPGYWLLYIEAKTGRILYPINPMVPRS